MMKGFLIFGFALFLAACNGLSPVTPEQHVPAGNPTGLLEGTTLPETGREEAPTIQSPLTTPVDGNMGEKISPTPVPLAQEAIDSCPVTLPNNKSPAEQSASDFNLGNDTGTLFTIPWPGGVVLFTPGGPGETRTDGSLAMKWPWFRTVRGEVVIDGRRLDADSPPMPTVILKGEPDGYGDTGFHPSGLTWPGEGCWEVTAQVGKEQLTFVTLVIKAPFDPLWPKWLPEGLLVHDIQVSTLPWSVQEIFRSPDASSEVMLETSQGVREESTPEGIPQQVTVHGQPGICIQGYRNEQGQWQHSADAAVLQWKEADFNYSIHHMGLDLRCEDLLKIAGS